MKQNISKFLNFLKVFNFFQQFFKKDTTRDWYSYFCVFVTLPGTHGGKKGTLTSWPAASAPPPPPGTYSQIGKHESMEGKTNHLLTLYRYHCKFIPLLWIIFSIWGDSLIRFTLKMIRVCRFDGTGHWLDMNQTFVD